MVSELNSEAGAWLEEAESRSMFAWMEQGETKRLVQATLSRSLRDLKGF